MQNKELGRKLDSEKLHKIEETIANYRKDILKKSENNNPSYQRTEFTDYATNQQGIVETLQKGQIVFQALQAFEGQQYQNCSDLHAPKPVKSLMFIWQLLNHILIDKSIPQTRKMLEVLIETQQQVTKLVSFTFKLRMKSNLCYHQSTVKCMLIFLYNYFLRLTELANVQELIAKQITGQEKLNEKLEIKIASQTLVYGTMINLFVLQYLNQKNKQFLTKQEQEWSIYIITLILSLERSVQTLTKHFQNMQSCSENPFQNFSASDLKMQFYHSFSSLISTAIQRRQTTQIVKGFPSHLSEIKLMYSQATKISIKITESDFRFLCYKLNKQIQSYINRIFQKITNSNKKHESDQLGQKDKKLRNQDEQMMLLLDFIGQITFLGGYNMQLQQLTTDLLMESLLKLLQVNYLIYILTQNPIRNVKMSKQTTPYCNQSTNGSQNSFISLNIQNLKKFASINNTLEETNQQSEFISNDQFLKLSALKQGILPLNLKILSNLVHINRKAQKYFQENLKYFHIVLALTHNIPSQLTMREWSIVFIRHVSECSETMRETIEKSKIDISTKPDVKNLDHIHTVQM